MFTIKSCFHFQPLLHISHYALPRDFHLRKEVGGTKWMNFNIIYRTVGQWYVLRAGLKQLIKAKHVKVVQGSTAAKFMRLIIVLLTGLIVLKVFIIIMDYLQNYLMFTLQVPNFGQLMALVGASCCTLLAYIMPALCHLVLFRLRERPVNTWHTFCHQVAMSICKN